MASNPPDEGFGIIAVDEKQLEGVDDNCNELDLKYKKKTVSKAVAASENSSPKMKQCSFLFIRYGLCSQSHGPVTTFEVFFVFYFYFFPNCNGHPDDRVHVIFQKWL